MPRTSIACRIAVLGALVTTAASPPARCGLWPDLNFRDLKDLSFEVLVPGSGNGFFVLPKPGVPKVAENFYLDVKWTVSGGTLSSPYLILWRYADRYQYIVAGTGDHADELQTGVHSRQFGPYQLDVDGPIGLWGHLDVTGVSGESPALVGNNEGSGSFTPVVPSVGVERYKTLTWDVTQTSFFVVPGGTSSAQFMLPRPVSDGYATVSATSAALTGIVFGQSNGYTLATQSGNLAAMPVYYLDKTAPTNGSDATWLLQQKFTAACSSIRVNPNILRTVTWSQIDGLQGLNYFKQYTTSDPGVIAPATTKVVDPDLTCIMPVGHAAMVAYINANLGANYRSIYTPYDAARKLYCCLLRDMTYTADADIKPHHSLAVLHYQLGDCGGYSMLIATLFRTMGIPCRIVVNEHHAWNEFYLTGHGWIPCDGSYYDAQSSIYTADYAYGFGVRNDLCNFVPLARGSDFHVGGLEHKWFQAAVMFRGHDQSKLTWPSNVTFSKVKQP